MIRTPIQVNVVNRALTDAQLVGDAAVAHSAQDQAYNGAFAVAQRGEPAAPAALLGQRETELHRLLEQLMVDPAAALSHRVETGE
jgi:hypothetical protein